MAEAFAFIATMAAVAWLMWWARFWLAPRVLEWLYGQAHGDGTQEQSE